MLALLKELDVLTISVFPLQNNRVNWKSLTSTEEVDYIINVESNQKTCIIFKHSTTCSISSIAKHRLESDWHAKLNATSFYYLDLLAHRNVSNYIAQALKVHHESPQIVIVKEGESPYDVSHLDISMDDLLSEV